MSAVLQARGAAASGQQPNGIVQQYQLAGTVASTTITPYDSGTILGTVPPGKAGIKLVSGVIQRATDLICDSTAGVTGNALVVTSGVGVVPTVNPAQLASAGLSLAPEHE